MKIKGVPVRRAVSVMNRVVTHTISKRVHARSLGFQVPIIIHMLFMNKLFIYGSYTTLNTNTWTVVEIRRKYFNYSSPINFCFFS